MPFNFFKKTDWCTQFCFESSDDFFLARKRDEEKCVRVALWQVRGGDRAIGPGRVVSLLASKPRLN